MKKLQHVIIDDHKLQLELSRPNNHNMTNIKRKRKESLFNINDKLSKTKIIIRNIPFETTSNELRELISMYGKIKRFRLPRRYDGRHRGFCFVDFVTAQETQNAINSISATHFYGRHLVVERAKQDELFDDDDENQNQQQDNEIQNKQQLKIIQVHKDEKKKKKKHKKHKRHKKND